MSIFSSASSFEEAVEKATSEMIPNGQENLAFNFEICDQIRAKLVQPRDAMRTLKKRLNHTNPNIVIHTLNLLDLCIKNGGMHFLIEIASQEFVNVLTSLATQHVPAIHVVLFPLLQSWALAFKDQQHLQLLYTQYIQLKNDAGIQFPDSPTSSTDHVLVIDTSVPPEWSDSSNCERCRTLFTLTNRKHHCRACGRTFCGLCSSNSIPLVHFGISEPVRVCDGCFGLGGKPSGIASTSSSKKSSTEKNSTGIQFNHHNLQEQDMQEQQQLERAIALSLAEERARRPIKDNRVSFAPVPSPTRPSYSPHTRNAEVDPDLDAAIAASMADVQIQNNNNNKIQSNPSNPVFTQQSKLQSKQPSEKQTDTITDEEIELVNLFASNMEKLQSLGTYEGSKALVMNREYAALYHTLTKMSVRVDVDLHDTLAVCNQLQEMHDKLTQCLRIYEEAVDVQISANRRDMHPLHATSLTPFQNFINPAVPHHNVGLHVDQHQYQSANTFNPVYYTHAQPADPSTNYPPPQHSMPYPQMAPNAVSFNTEHPLSINQQPVFHPAQLENGHGNVVQTVLQHGHYGPPTHYDPGAYLPTGPSSVMNVEYSGHSVPNYSTYPPQPAVSMNPPGGSVDLLQQQQQQQQEQQQINSSHMPPMAAPLEAPPLIDLS